MIPEPLATNVASFLWIGAVVSVVLMVFNLLPIPPLDGSRILANVSLGYRRLFFESEQGALVGFGVFLLAFFFLGDYLWSGGFLIATLATEVMLFVITGGQAGGHGGAVTP
jgi:Zn-dependent protease